MGLMSDGKELYHWGCLCAGAPEQGYGPLHLYGAWNAGY
jgi:hypothetical protein